ncbi:hypothetical protein MPTK1_7g10270 [Marchantia polymorpha subsp. ruderalis]|uniref:Uncharacterized protein n=2 Tax=Marchantia polymorpha TaxID=3197 RepID=A0AAF6BY19_MARPO|nr:hypothetical protein MARPO_0003s0047 [Marchantia polymorpha]BBN16903.1 hypothetical protein Mp_7g10270 [Marchantia polymorpha subsp. ruderalis]|eukprot:PTQ49144.1 hypothetical protein MARPO_0003s0047 [Marchantia polymorpha]
MLGGAKSGENERKASALKEEANELIVMCAKHRFACVESSAPELHVVPSPDGWKDVVRLAEFHKPRNLITLGAKALHLVLFVYSQQMLAL